MRLLVNRIGREFVFNVNWHTRKLQTRLGNANDAPDGRYLSWVHLRVTKWSRQDEC